MKKQHGCCAQWQVNHRCRAENTVPALQSFEIEQGFFRLYKQGKRSSFFGTATETIANLHVFLALLQQTSPVGEMEEV